jgi:hypothetical protein
MLQDMLTPFKLSRRELLVHFPWKVQSLIIQETGNVKYAIEEKAYGSISLVLLI